MPASARYLRGSRSCSSPSHDFSPPVFNKVGGGEHDELVRHREDSIMRPSAVSPSPCESKPNLPPPRRDQPHERSKALVDTRPVRSQSSRRRRRATARKQAAAPRRGSTARRPAPRRPDRSTRNLPRRTRSSRRPSRLQRAPAARARGAATLNMPSIRAPRFQNRNLPPSARRTSCRCAATGCATPDTSRHDATPQPPARARRRSARPRSASAPLGHTPQPSVLKHRAPSSRTKKTSRVEEEASAAFAALPEG